MLSPVRKMFSICLLCKKTPRIAEKHNIRWINAHPDNDAHPFTLRCEGKGLKDVEGKSLSRWSLQLQGVQVSVYQGQADTLSPPHQLNLSKSEREKYNFLYTLSRFMAYTITFMFKWIHFYVINKCIFLWAQLYGIVQLT